MYKEREKVKPTSCTRIPTQGLCFYILTSAFCKTSLRKERSVFSEVHSLPAIKLLSNATCRQETKRRVEKKSALSIRHSLQEPAHLYQLLQTTLRDVPSDGRPTETPNSKVQLAVSLLTSIVTVTWNTTIAILASIWWVSKFCIHGFIKPDWWQLEASSKHTQLICCDCSPRWGAFPPPNVDYCSRGSRQHWTRHIPRQIPFPGLHRQPGLTISIWKRSSSIPPHSLVPKA